MTRTEELRRKRRHAIVKAVGLWPWYGRMSLAYYKWAAREIRPCHPDSAKVGRRYYQLSQEFQS